MKRCMAILITLLTAAVLLSFSASAESPLFGLQLSVSENRVTISWQPVDNAAYYEVHGVENGQDRVLYTTERTEYADPTVGGSVNEYVVVAHMNEGTDIMRNSRRQFLSDRLELFSISVPEEIYAVHSHDGWYNIFVKGLSKGMNLQLQMRQNGGSWENAYVGTAFNASLKLCYNSSYSFRARSLVSIGGTTYSSAYCTPFALDTSVGKPKTLSAKAKNYKTAELSWEKPKTAVSGYCVYRRSGTSGWKRLAFVSKAFYRDSTLCPAITYYYKICAYEKIGKQYYYGDYCSQKAVISKLSKPSLDSEITVSCSSARFTWGNVSGSTGYIIEQRAAGGKWKTVKTTKNLSATVKGLTVGKTYYFRMRAYRSVSGKNYYSDYSAARRVKPVFKKPKLTAKSTGGKIKLSTNKNSGVSGYEVYYATKKSGTYKKLTQKSGSKLKYTYKGKKSKRYYFKVRAYKKGGSKKRYSAFSSVVSCKI